MRLVYMIYYQKKLFSDILVILRMITSCPLYHSVNCVSFFNIYVAILIRLSPIDVCIVLVTQCIKPYCLRFDWIFFQITSTFGSDTYFKFRKPLVIYDFFGSSSLNSISLITVGESRTVIFLRTFNLFCGGS